MIYVELVIFVLLTVSNFSIYSDNNAFKNYKKEALHLNRKNADNLAQIRNMTDNHTDYEEAGKAGRFRSGSVEGFLKGLNGTSGVNQKNILDQSFDIYF